jgi:hypothetical protein
VFLITVVVLDSITCPPVTIKKQAEEEESNAERGEDEPVRC